MDVRVMQNAPYAATSIDGVDYGEFDQGSVGGCRARRARRGVRLVYGADFQRRKASPGGRSGGLQSPRHRKGDRGPRRWATHAAVLGLFRVVVFDGLFDDGTVVVVLFGDNWLYYGSHKRVVNIE